MTGGQSSRRRQSDGKVGFQASCIYRLTSFVSVATKDTLGFFDGTASKNKKADVNNPRLVLKTLKLSCTRSSNDRICVPRKRMVQRFIPESDEIPNHGL